MAHVGLSLATGWIAAHLLRDLYPAHLWSLRGFWGTLALCVPGLGALGIFGLLFLYRYGKFAKEPLGVRQVKDPGFRRDGPGQQLRYAIGDIQSVLTTSTISDTQRMQALFKMQSLQSRQTTRILQSLLLDKSEDLRLVAFGLLDKTEKSIFSNIHRQLKFLSQAVGKAEKIECFRQLAYTYWELVYQDAVKGDVRVFAFNQVRMYASHVLFEEERDGGMWSLMGQVNLSLQDLEIARFCFSQALTCGLPESRVIPYMAEVLFLQREYAALQVLLSIQSSVVDFPAFSTILRYWEWNPSAPGKRERDAVHL